MQIQKSTKTDKKQIPEEWELITIKDISKVRRGASPRPIEDPRYFGDRRGWIRIADVTKTKKYLEKTKDYLSELGESKSVPVNPGDLIMSIAATVGKPIIIKMNACIHDGFVHFSNLSKDIDVEFFYYLLTTFQDKFGNIGQHGTQKNLNIEIVSNTKILKPPLKEQQKIASILSKVDELIQKTEHIIEQTQRLKKGLMQRLLTKGIGHTKFKKIDWLFGKKIEIPEEWNIVSLREVCKNITDGKHGDCENEYNSGYYFISAKDIFDGKIHYENARQITKSDFIESHKRTKIESGDILLTNSGSIGKLAIVENVFNASRTTFQKSVAILKPDIEKIFVKFFYYYLFHNQQQLETIASGSSQKNLLLRQLDSFKIILPSISEQQKIGHILSNLDSNIQNQKDQKSISENIKKSLMQQLLTGKIRVKV